MLDASAGVEILNRTASGIQLARWLEGPSFEVWTVEHFHLEVAKVFGATCSRVSLTDTKPVDGSLCSLSGSSTSPGRPAAGRRMVDAAQRDAADALYVALARQLDATLLTADRKLARLPVSTSGRGWPTSSSPEASRGQPG